MGRPPKPEEEKRTVRQQVLLTPAERELLERARDVLAVPMGDILREAGLRYARNALRRAERRPPTRKRRP